MVKNTSKVIFPFIIFFYFIVVYFKFDYKNFFKKYYSDKSQKFKDIILLFKNMKAVKKVVKKKH